MPEILPEMRSSGAAWRTSRLRASLIAFSQRQPCKIDFGINKYYQNCRWQIEGHCARGEFFIFMFDVNFCQSYGCKLRHVNHQSFVSTLIKPYRHLSGGRSIREADTRVLIRIFCLKSFIITSLRCNSLICDLTRIWYQEKSRHLDLPLKV